MAEIEGINAHLQSRLLAEDRVEVNAVEAARWLDEQGLLADRKERPGLPLRRLLRGGTDRGCGTASATTLRALANTTNRVKRFEDDQDGP